MFYSKNMTYLRRIAQMASKLYPMYSLPSSFVRHWPTATVPQVVLLITALGQAVHLLKALLHALFWYLKEPRDINCSITSALAKLDWLLVPEQCPQCPEVREEPGLRASEWIPPNPQCVAVWGCILTGLSQSWYSHPLTNEWVKTPGGR